MSEYRKHLKCGCGKQMSIDLNAQQGKQYRGNFWHNFESISLAVQEDQVKEQKTEDKRLGVGFMEYAPMGDGFYTPKPKNAADWRRYRKAHHFYDKSGYNGY